MAYGRYHRVRSLVMFFYCTPCSCSTVFDANQGQRNQCKTFSGWVFVRCAQLDHDHVLRPIHSDLGTTSVLFTYPLELIRVRLAYQTRHASQRYSLMDTITTIYREGSPPSATLSPIPVPSPRQSHLFASFPLLKFYRGFSATILGMIPYAGTSFLSWDLLRATVYGTDVSPSRKGNLAIGAISGMLGQTVSYPFEVVRRRMQVGGLTQPDRWMSWKETVWMVWQGRGWRGFYVGLSIGYLKVVPMTAVSFAVWEEMKRVLAIN